MRFDSSAYDMLYPREIKKVIDVIPEDDKMIKEPKEELKVETKEEIKEPELEPEEPEVQDVTG